ncbi:Phosphatidylinositol-glycan biosynthesis class X protein [Lonchura striata]|uniref:Phosphatidylinositol-glycan biosynthesis class X protein n=1 Tax=Lonchura striata TaxID=40157 RepID=A0A218UBK9_9PASE|nr:Phosphatidylinositol-glycan biosynthesis class X protein [Lonchura striata domestica]
MGFKVSSNPNQEICSALIAVNYFFPSSWKGFADEVFVSYKVFAAPVVAVLLHFWLCVTLDVQAACRDTTVTQELLKEGFHRDLLVKVELGEDAGGCAVAAQMHLPPGIYVDPYELATLQQHNLTKAVLFPDVIDVEAPEYLAEALVLLLFLEPDARCSRCFGAAVPVHARYHRPARGTRQAVVALQSPEVLLCCCHRMPSLGHLSAECWEPAEVDTPCSSDTNSPCQWHTTKHKPAYEESMLRVPVGLREHSSLVCALTLLTTGLCSGLILAAACKYGHFSQ